MDEQRFQSEFFRTRPKNMVFFGNGKRSLRLSESVGHFGSGIVKWF